MNDELIARLEAVDTAMRETVANLGIDAVQALSWFPSTLRAKGEV